MKGAVRKNVETPLSRSLASTEGRPTPRRALEIGQRKFLACERIEMKEVAEELGVNPATLFRWVGSRDQFVAEVYWSLSVGAFERVVRTAKGRGAERVARIMEAAGELMQRSKPFQAFLRREPERALRILTMGSSIVQQRVVAEMERVLREEVERGALEPRLPLRDLAYVVTRIGESFSYTDVITGSKPDTAKAVRAVRLLLR